MNVTRTFDLLDRYKQLFQKETALAIKRSRKWESWSTDAYIESCHDVACGLLELGLKKGDKIITVTNNRPEWNFADHGMAMCGIVHVPLYTSLNEQEYSYIIKHSEAKMALVSDKKLFQEISNGAAGKLTSNQIYTFDEIEGLPCWQTITEAGKNNREKWSKKLKEIKDSILEKDFASLLYTSGTTGQPKAVMLSHENLVKNFIAAAGIFKLTPGDKYLSILPLCHVGGRMGNYQTQYSGTGIYYPENMGAFVTALKEIRADGFDAVPRVLEKVYDNIIAKGNQLTGMKKKIFFWAVRLGFKYNACGKNSWWYRKRLALADKLIFSKWRDALGGNVRLVGCGGASLQPRLEKLFWAAGVKIINMYGLTETSPIITISNTEKGKFKLGTVGSLIEGVELKIAGDGEILCRGHNVMLGYYKDDKMTNEVFDKEGWFHTGDIGHLEDEKFLAVTDRKMEIFNDLGLFDGVEYLPVPEFYRFFNGRTDLVMPHDREAAIALLKTHFPGEEQGIDKYFQRLMNARRINLLERDKPDISIGEFLDSIFTNEEIKLVLLGNLGYFHDDPYTLSLRYFSIAESAYFNGRANFIRGGSQQLSDRLMAVIREHGGKVLLSHKVTSLEITENRIKSVTFINTLPGDHTPVKAAAKEFVANAALPQVAAMMSEGAGSDILREIGGHPVGASLLTVYYGFSTSLKTLGHTHYSTFVFDESVHHQRDIHNNNRGDFSKRGFTFVDYSQVDSQLAPEGKSVGAICCIDYLDDWKELSREAYLAKKREVAEVMTDRLEKLIPGVRQHIAHIEVGTAKTVQRYTLNPGGAVYGFAQLPNRAPLKSTGQFSNLNIASAWGKFGGGFSGVIYSGYMTAVDMERKMK
ncbi:MAG: AMP-binding protein [Bacteroidales bacterium]